jgi:hypothetical protein
MRLRASACASASMRGAVVTRVGASLAQKEQKRNEDYTRLAAGEEKTDRQHSGANTDVARASQSDQVLDGKPAG